MTPVWRKAWPVIGALLVGTLGYALLGNSPRSSAARVTPKGAWALPVQSAPDLAAAQALWSTRPPWGAAAAGQTAQAAVPSAIPVGVVMDRGGLQAVFALPGAIPFHVREGDPLPGGGQVTAISRTQVTWTDAAGNTRQRELLVGPVPSTTSGG